MVAQQTTSPSGNARGSILKMAAVVCAAVLLALTFVYATQRSMYYAIDPTDPGPAIRYFPQGQDVRLSTSDGLNLSAWKIYPDEPNGQAVLYLPGNGGNRSHRAGLGQTLADEGFTVLLIDYRGFGGNPGDPSEEGLVNDARAAIAHLTQNNFRLGQILYVGESIGAGVATQVAVSHPPAAMLLRSPFTSLADAADHRLKLPIGSLVWDQFDSLAVAPKVNAPVAVLAGSTDTIVPANQSRKLAGKFPNLVSFTEIDGVGHNDELWFGEFLAEQVTALAKSTRNDRT